MYYPNDNNKHVFLIDATENNRNTRDNTFPSYNSEEFLLFCFVLDRSNSAYRSEKTGFLAAIDARKIEKLTIRLYRGTKLLLDPV